MDNDIKEVVDLLDMTDGAIRRVEQIDVAERAQFAVIALDGLSHAVRKLAEIAQQQDERIQWLVKELQQVRS